MSTSIWIRFIREGHAFPLLLFKLLREYWKDLSDADARQRMREFAERFVRIRNCVLGYFAETHRARYPTVDDLLGITARYALLAQALLQWTCSIATENVHSRGRREVSLTTDKAWPMTAERLAARTLIYDAIVKFEAFKNRFAKNWERDPPPLGPGDAAIVAAPAQPPRRNRKGKVIGRPRGSWPYRVWRSRRAIHTDLLTLAEYKAKVDLEIDTCLKLGVGVWNESSRLLANRNL